MSDTRIDYLELMHALAQIADCLDRMAEGIGTGAVEPSHGLYVAVCKLSVASERFEKLVEQAYSLHIALQDSTRYGRGLVQ